MRATASLIPALLITLGLLYLMQFMVSGHSQRISRLEDYGVVDFVRLHRETEKPIISPPRRPRPSSPADAAPPSSPKLANVEPAMPASPDLTAEFPGIEQPSVNAKPYLGPLPVKAPKPVAAAKPRIAVKKPAKPAPGRNAAIQKPSKTALASLPKSGLGSQPGAIGGTALGVPGAGGAGDGNLIPLFKMAPQYPRKAAMSGKEGWVKVAFTITKRGTVTDAVVVESKPRRVFNRSALKAIRKWRFKPQVVDGKPVPTRATQVIEFTLASK